MGWGPLGPRASAVRPAADPDTYGGIATWFKNCSAPGAADGTVPTASWFNWLIGNLSYACTQAGVTVPNDQTDDTLVWDMIQNAITERLDNDVTMGTMSII